MRVVSTRLAGASTRQHQNRALGGEHRLFLLRVQALEVIGLAMLLVACGHGACGNAAGSGRAASRSVVIAEKRHIVGKIGHLARM